MVCGGKSFRYPNLVITPDGFSRGSDPSTIFTNEYPGAITLSGCPARAFGDTTPTGTSAPMISVTEAHQQTAPLPNAPACICRLLSEVSWVDGYSIRRTTRTAISIPT